MAEKSFLDRAAAYTYEELDRLGGETRLHLVDHRVRSKTLGQGGLCST
jgi:hypothetical protein